jgi:hypothetical protein
MTDFHDPHAPSPEFRAALKLELQRQYRTERQFGSVYATRSGRLGMMIGVAAGAVITLTVGLVLGAATGYASAEGVAERHREAAAKATTQRQFAAMRLDLARTNYEAVRRDFDAGLASAATLRAAKTAVDSMEANVARIEADIADTTQSALSILKSNPVKTALTALSCAAGPAAEAPAVQQGIPVIGVSPAAAKTITTLGGVLGVRELADGRLLVNDAARRQIKVFDAKLATATVAQDSVDGRSNSYGPRAAQIVRYFGDSTLFTELITRDASVLDQNGQFVRAIAPPSSSIDPDVRGGPAVPFPQAVAMDHKGRLFGRAGTRVRNGVVADSTLILRADLESRQVDVVGAVHHTGSHNRRDPEENGYRVVTTIRQPVPLQDSWAVLSDGTIAFVRGQDYHVDWILPDGTKSATTKLPFDWKRLTDADKQKLVDSARVVADSMMAIRNARANSNPIGRGDNPGSDGPQPGRGRSSGGAPAPGQQGSIQRVDFVPLSEIPDYYPPIRENSATADLDGNLWILPTTSAQSQRGELVYDVVNPKQGLFRRVRMPLGRSIAGFGKGGVLYLQSGDRANGFYIERVKLEAK